MGVSNKQRRAAKKRKVAARAKPTGAREAFIPVVTPEMAREFVWRAVREVGDDLDAADGLAVALLRPDSLVPPSVLRPALHTLLLDLTAGVVTRGWRPSDLVQAVTRRLGRPLVPRVVALVTAETDRHPGGRVGAAWRDELVAAGPSAPVDLADAADVSAALRLAACLAALPAVAVLLPPPGKGLAGAGSARGDDPRLLAKVRALLAKAESTEFDEEAEALSAKAQELISRHALDRLLLEADADVPDTAPLARRLWVEPPYVFAKSLLVQSVAEANHCRCVVSVELGFCTVLGQEADLAAVDLLVTSLLVQAGTAMRRHGRQIDGSGTSRTTSFRQSFLVSYASRIGERLLAAGQEAVQETGRAGELVPVLNRRAEQVDAATSELFPELVSRRASINNARGWAAGRAAADQARLDTGQQIARAAG